MLKIREVAIGEQTAYQLLQFLQRYRADLRHLRNLEPDGGQLQRYLAAMDYGDRRDAERLEKKIKSALERRLS